MKNSMILKSANFGNNAGKIRDISFFIPAQCKYLDSKLYNLGWEEKSFDTSITIDGVIHATPTHKVDCVKGRIALDIEWNNKTEFYDRDLNNFRLLHSLRAISVGIIITRATELQTLVFKPLGIKDKYGSSTDIERVDFL